MSDIQWYTRGPNERLHNECSWCSTYRFPSGVHADGSKAVRLRLRYLWQATRHSLRLSSEWLIMQGWGWRLASILLATRSFILRILGDQTLNLQSLNVGHTFGTNSNAQNFLYSWTGWWCRGGEKSHKVWNYQQRNHRKKESERSGVCFSALVAHRPA